MPESSTIKEPTIHYIPAMVKYDGAAEVGSYFESSRQPATVDSNGYETAMFRGRFLCGLAVQLPLGHRLYVTEERDEADRDCDEEQRDAGPDVLHLKVVQKADKFIYWNWDREPSASDAVRRAIEWVDIATALSGQKNTDLL